MGQSSSQQASQLVEEAEVNGKEEARKKSKKRKEKKKRDSGGHTREEEIAQALLEMKGSQALEHTANSDEDNIAAANQLHAESSPARDATSSLVYNGGPVQQQRTEKAKHRIKKKDRRKKSNDIAAVYSYVEDLLGANLRDADEAVNVAQTHSLETASSQPVPSLAHTDSNDENIAPELREIDRSSGLVEPATPISYLEAGLERDCTTSSPTASTYEKRKRKTTQENRDSTTEIPESLENRSVTGDRATPIASAQARQVNGRTPLRRPNRNSAIGAKAVTGTNSRRQWSPDLYDLPADSVLPGIEDPTSPAKVYSGQRGKRQRQRAITTNGDVQQDIASLTSFNGDLGDDHASQVEAHQPSGKAPPKRKRRLPVDDSPNQGSTRAPKKRKPDYKTAQVRKVTQGEVGSLEEGARKEGPFSESEIAKLFSFRDQYCEENDVTPQKFIEQVHASAHNNRKNINFWNEVSDVLPYRTRHSLQRLCRRRFHNFTKRGKWTEEEDKELREAHAQHGNKWKVIGEQIERMPEDCRDRWRNYLKDSGFRNHDSWTPYEVESLREAVAECRELMRRANEEQRKKKSHGRDPRNQEDEDENDVINWVIVSERLGGSRSRLQCSWKWKHLAEQSDKPQQNMKKIVKRGPKTLNAWRARRAEKKYPLMLPGDKYELLNALSQLGGRTDDASITWGQVGPESLRAVWAPQDCKYAYFKMKETMLDDPDDMTLGEIIEALKRELEEDHPDELDRHYMPPAEDRTASKKQKKPKPKSDLKKFKKRLSNEMVDESDLSHDEANTNNGPHGDGSIANGIVPDEQSATPTTAATPTPDQSVADNNDNDDDRAQSNIDPPEPDNDTDIDTDTETDSNPAPSEVLAGDHNVSTSNDNEQEQEEEIPDSD